MGNLAKNIKTQQPAMNSIKEKENENVISSFIESIRLAQPVSNHDNHVVSSHIVEDSNQEVVTEQRVERNRLQINDAAEKELAVENAKDRAEKAIIEAEKFHATITNPPGMFGDVLGSFHNVQNHAQNVGQGLTNMPVAAPFDAPVSAVQSHWEGGNGQNILAASQPMGNLQFQSRSCHENNNQMLDMGNGVSDDDFFHLTCHIEPSLIHKIEKGEFVELEKLLPKDRLSGHKNNHDESRLEWVQRDGGTFLVLANRDGKITGIRCWEQAFRAYATIYCGANPHRAKEIWQYIAVINTAAVSFMWDNVYNYDITFRHLMAFNSNRSWAITYNQMWNLSMKDPLPRNNAQRNSFRSHGGNSKSNGSNNGQQHKRLKADYCWNFNKGVKCRFGNRCKFIERCSFCDSGAHGLHACPKAKEKKQNGNGHNNGGNGGNNANANANV